MKLPRATDTRQAGAPSASMNGSASAPALPRLRGSGAVPRRRRLTPSYDNEHREHDDHIVIKPATAVSAASSTPTDVASAASPWTERYKLEARRELAEEDISALLARFEDLSVPPRARKPLTSMTLLGKHAASMPFAGLPDDPEDPSGSGMLLPRTSLGAGGGGSGAHATTMALLPGASVTKLRRQATKLILERHTKPTGSGSGSGTAAAPSTLSRVVPTRFLFDSTRWPRSARCDYCQLAGGDLECATCDVIAHARCYLAAYEILHRKTKGAFIVPTRFSWLCQHCQAGLQDEYDERSKRARTEHIANQRTVFGKVVKAYVRMTRDALSFKKKKDAIIRIQAIMRGRLARVRFNRLQRMRLKPYAVDAIRLHGFRREFGGTSMTGLDSASSAGNTTGSASAGGSTDTGEELRLANGFTCNPYVYVTIVDGDDDDSQLFCFETAVRKGVATTENELVWPDRMFVPGVNGNVTFCFTVLSKNGPNNFVLGQGVVRLRDSDVTWRTGAAFELVLSTEVEIFPRTAQRQPLRLADTAAHLVHLRGTGSGSTGRSRHAHPRDPVFANGSSAALTLSVHLRPFSEVQSYCGYMLTKNTLDSFQTSQRWCVLADGTLRIYRHYGVTLATEIVDMSRTIEIKLVETRNVHRQEQWIAMEHMTRLYIFQCERHAATKQWLKKLLGAVRFSTTAPTQGISSAESTSRTTPAVT